MEHYKSQTSTTKFTNRLQSFTDRLQNLLIDYKRLQKLDIDYKVLLIDYKSWT